MPAVSKKQQKFMGIVRSIQKGEQPAGKFSKDAQDAAKSMRKSSVKKYAATKHKGKPEKVKSEAKERDYKKEYKKFQSSTKAKKYRAELNKYNRQKGTYGNGDGKDASHKGGKIVGFESQSKNRGRAEKSRLKKEQMIGRLKEMIRQELSEYTYGTGDVVKDVNPSCPHYGAMGKVKSVNPRSVVFVVMNKGKNFKPGMELEKSHDQMKKMSESINEFSIKLKKSTQDMVNALLKVKSPMPKEIESALIMMAKGYGLDYVKREVQRDAKGFYKNLKQMAAAFPELKKKPKDYKFESIIQERNDEVQTGKEYTKLWLQSINLVMKQANSLKGALAKHPIKRDLNKLKAVENLFKKFIKPAVEREGKDNRHYAPNQTELKKYLSDTKFKVAIRILKQTLKPANGYDENSFYYLGDKEKKLLEKMSKVLYDIETKLDNANLENINEKKKKMFPPDKMTPKQAKEYKRFIDYAKMGIEYKIDMSLFESINEDGHTDVASSKRKVMIMVDDSNKLLNKLNGMNKEDSLPSWWTDKITLSQNYLEKATNYLLNPVKSVNEGKGVDKIMKMADDYSYGKIAGKTVDVMTAKLFQAAYNKAPQKAKDKVDKMNEKQLYIFMMNLWKRFGKQVRLGS